MDLGNTIKTIRKKAGINQKTFAEMCNITPSYLSQIESNSKEPNVSTLKTIAEKLDFPLPFIFFLSIDESDIKPEKKEAFNMFAPTVKSMISTLISNS